MSYEQSLEAARQFRKDHPAPPAVTRVVDYFLGPDGKRHDPPEWFHKMKRG